MMRKSKKMGGRGKKMGERGKGGSVCTALILPGNSWISCQISSPASVFQKRSPLCVGRTVSEDSSRRSSSAQRSISRAKQSQAMPPEASQNSSARHPRTVRRPMTKISLALFSFGSGSFSGGAPESQAEREGICVKRSVPSKEAAAGPSPRRVSPCHTF